MIRCLLLFVLWAAAAQAQDIVYSNHATDNCLMQRDTRERQLDCIGASADACMQRSAGGYSTYGMGACLERERVYLDNRLNRIYQRVMSAERRSGRAEGLRAMQRVWITYRDTRCEYEASQWGGGTGAGPAFVACLMTVTGEQALLLRQFEQ